MATRKKPPASPPAPPADTAHFVVLLEDMHSQFRVFNEALQSHREESARQFALVNQQFERSDRRFASLELAVQENGRSIGQLRQDTYELREDTRELRVELRRDVSDIRGTLERIEIAVATKVDRDEVESIVHTVLGRT